MADDEKEDEHEKREDEAMDGDGIVTMRHMKKKLMEHKLFACKRSYGCKTW